MLKVTINRINRNSAVAVIYRGERPVIPGNFMNGFATDSVSEIRNKLTRLNIPTVNMHERMKRVAEAVHSALHISGDEIVEVWL